MADALKQRGSLELWFDPEMVWVPPPGGKRGYQQLCSDAVMPWSLYLATVERIPPPEPRREQDALGETDGAEPHGVGFRPAGR